MRKIFIGLILVLLMLCAAGAALLRWDAIAADEPCPAGQVPSLTGMLDTEQLEKERNLARWYNFTLREESLDTELPDAYDQLLDFGMGKMGYLEMPGQGLFLPIVHESAEMTENCVIHSFGTALPVGGRGNCPVLRCGVAGISISEGDVFCVHVLDAVLTYQVTKTGSVPPQNSGGEDLCILQLFTEAGTVYVTGMRMEIEPDRR